MIFSQAFELISNIPVAAVIVAGSLASLGIIVWFANKAQEAKEHRKFIRDVARRIVAQDRKDAEIHNGEN